MFNRKKQYKEFVNQHMKNILYVANLDDYILSVTSLTQEKETEGAAATADVDYEYLRFTLACDEKYFEKGFKNKEYDSLLNILCHEAAHVITSELPDMIGLEYKGNMKFYIERNTERVGRLIHRLYNNWMKNNKIKIETGK